MSNKPSIGRIVHYRPTARQNKIWGNTHGINTSECLPAIITRVNDDETVNLKLFTDGERNEWIKASKEGTDPGSWSWPVTGEA